MRQSSTMLLTSLFGAFVVLGGCGEPRTAVKTDTSTPSDAQIPIDAGPVDTLRPLDQAPGDSVPGCGRSVIDGNLASTHFNVGCPPLDGCPIDRTMTLQGTTGWFVDESRGCTLPRGYMLTARLVLAKRSRVTLELRTQVKTAAETSFRALCSVRQCGKASANTMMLDPGEHTVEIMTEEPTDFSLDVTISPVLP